MATEQNSSDHIAYKPTSLDFINRPNPVEPHAVPENHPLNNTPRLENGTNRTLLRLLIDQSVQTTIDRPTKRRKSTEGTPLDLPRLPAVRHGAKRLRIPPTLSGLHQPPPDAGLLPSMSIEQPIELPERSVRKELTSLSGVPAKKTGSSSSGVEPISKESSATSCKPDDTHSSKKRRNKWSREETACLLKGVARFGIGNWTQILHCPDYQFERRTAIDLKDRFRVCCPDDYKTTRTSKKTIASKVNRQSPEQMPKEAPGAKDLSRLDRKTSSELLDLGISQPFKKSERRTRTEYSAAEDEALLKGFEKHSNSWATIRQDEELGLSKRTATDLRDRFRTRYPERYEQAGLAPRPEVFPKKARRGTKQDGRITDLDTKKPEPKQQASSIQVTHNISERERTEKENREPQPPKRQPPASLLHYDDVFWGAPFDTDESESGITLDRRILDWPSDIARTPATIDKGGTNSMSTLDFHQRQPNALRSGANTMQIGTTAALPSLAAITADPSGIDDQIELPSLMGAFGTLEGDSRAGHFPSLDELWK